MAPREVVRAPMRVHGLEIRTTNAAERDPGTARIPSLWEKVAREGIVGSRTPVAVYLDYASDDRGPYTLLVGVEARPGEAVPGGLRAVDVPGGRCLLFEARGPMPKALIETWGLVWDHFRAGSRPTRLYSADVEIHTGPDAVDLYVGIG